MRKICLTVIGIYLLFLNAFSQVKNDSTGTYKNKNLKLEEVNLISGYYNQNGNHSAVTGGIGTQQLSDVSNIIQLKFIRWDDYNKKHTTDIEAALDHHTAASSAFVSKTGTSGKGGTRFYPSVNWKTENEEHRTIAGWGVSYSAEYNYHSFGTNFNFSKTSKDKNREFDAKAQVFLDRVKMILPSELVPAPTVIQPRVITSASGRTSYFGGGILGKDDDIPASQRNTFMTSFTLSQVINRNLQVSLLADGVLQQGYLGLPFHRVYWKDGSVHVEKLPDQRLKLPVGLRLNYFSGDHVVFRTYYRFYTDSWGLTAHTASLEVPVKITSFLSVSPFYRYYRQTAIDYFAAYGKHTSASTFYTSNYDYSAFKSDYVGINIRMAPPKGVLGIRAFNLMELRAGRYIQTTGLTANNVSVNLRFK